MIRWLLSWIVFILIVLALLKYFFDWSIFEALQTPAGQGTVEYIRVVLVYVWEFSQDTFNYLLQKVKEFIPV